MCFLRHFDLKKTSRALNRTGSFDRRQKKYSVCPMKWCLGKKDVGCIAVLSAACVIANGGQSRSCSSTAQLRIKGQGLASELALKTIAFCH